MPAKKKTSTKDSTEKKVVKKKKSTKKKEETTKAKAPTQEKKETKKNSTELPEAVFVQERVLLDNCDETQDFYNNGAYGKQLEDKKLQLSLQEALYLMDKKKIRIKDLRGVFFTFERFLKKAIRIEPNFWVRYSVYKDMRARGYVIKTALKFGADFRVYDRGIKPGEDHARWIIYPVHEGSTLTWYEFAAKNRVAHSTKKRLMMGVVDDEGDVTYWEIKWMRP